MVVLVKQPAQSSPFEDTKSLKHKVSHWFKNVTKPKCTCQKVVPLKPRKEKKPFYIAEPIEMPQKYANDTKVYTLVAGQRLPYTPSQISHVKKNRRVYETIDEDLFVCDYCKARSNTLFVEDY
ncbi:hypothetical protein Ae201684P_022325 [Aphanomyces euteiches]|uniref:Uncharacterized protein n=1 Tax=Aphanomyces euteiches TaxID=100861 RepID=A0A6G0X6M2_9STRA|nr:hypothetical protein Ae201684_007973 [Aphanomyces euteiches]KAH9074518.1 hypothetical protein Ae201684P_022325 [Aphanomyces euteiches]KAH9153159.1 hypothetical protein AeRB84_004536 [Aphanomyces euteiches]